MQNFLNSFLLPGIGNFGQLSIDEIGIMKKVNCIYCHGTRFQSHCSQHRSTPQVASVLQNFQSWREPDLQYCTLLIGPFDTIHVGQSHLLRTHTYSIWWSPWQSPSVFSATVAKGRRSPTLVTIHFDCCNGFGVLLAPHRCIQCIEPVLNPPHPPKILVPPHQLNLANVRPLPHLDIPHRHLAKHEQLVS